MIYSLIKPFLEDDTKPDFTYLKFANKADVYRFLAVLKAHLRNQVFVNQLEQDEADKYEYGIRDELTSSPEFSNLDE